MFRFGGESFVLDSISAFWLPYLIMNVEFAAISVILLIWYDPLTLTLRLNLRLNPNLNPNPNHNPNANPHTHTHPRPHPNPNPLTLTLTHPTFTLTLTAIRTPATRNRVPLNRRDPL